MLFTSTVRLGFNLLIILIFILFTNSIIESHFKDKNLLRRVRRNMICKERQYLRERPLSESLRNFIRRVKRENQKKKESNTDKMYVIKGGNVIPFKQLNIRDTGEFKINKDDSLLQGKFTVVPLIVPKNTEVCVETTKGEPEANCLEGLDNFMNQSTTVSTVSTNATTNIKAIEKVTDEYDMVPIEATTKGELLGKVIKDIKELASYEKKSRPQGEASLCNVTGDWDSFSGGIQVRITLGYGENHLARIPKIYIVPMDPPRDGFLTTDIWNATGITPFPNASMISFTVISTTSKKLAMFLGECRICEGAESITGFWMLRRRSKNCKDREEANTFFSDVLRKNNIRRLQHEHMEQIASTVIPPIERK